MHAMAKRFRLHHRFLFVTLDRRAASLACVIADKPGVVLLDEGSLPKLAAQATSKAQETKAQVSNLNKVVLLTLYNT
jgi:hypothetical protein